MVARDSNCEEVVTAFVPAAVSFPEGQKHSFFLELGLPAVGTESPQRCGGDLNVSPGRNASVSTPVLEEY